MEISSPPGNKIGKIKQKWDPFFPKFEIEDDDDHTILKIDGPFCTCGFGDVEFKV